MSSTEHDLPEVDVEAPQNLIEGLRQKRQELTENRETAIQVPGYDDPALLVQYRLMDGEEVNKIARKALKGGRRDSWQANVLGAVDVMIAACIGILVDTGEGPQPLTFNGKQIDGFSPELAEALAIPDTGTARSVVFGLFGGNDLAISGHSMRLQRWFSNTNAEVDEDFLLG